MRSYISKRDIKKLINAETRLSSNLKKDNIITKKETTENERNHWKVPSINLIKFLEPGEISQTLSTGEKINSSDLKYTILDKKNVFREPQEIMELCLATHESDPINCVAFRPERIALHQAISTVITQVQLIITTKEDKSSLEYDAIFLDIMKQVMDHMKKDVDTASVLLNKRYKEIGATIRDLVNESKQDKLQYAYVNTIIECKKKIKNEKLGSHVPRYCEKQALIALSTDAIYTNEATSMMLIFFYYEYKKSNFQNLEPNL